MKETRMPPAQSANLAANSGNTIYGVGVIERNYGQQNFVVYILQTTISNVFTKNKNLHPCIPIQM